MQALVGKRQIPLAVPYPTEVLGGETFKASHNKAAGIKVCKKSTLPWNNGRKEEQDDYPTPAICAADIGYSLVFCFSLPPLFYSRSSLLSFFHSCLVSVVLQVHRYLK